MSDDISNSRHWASDTSAPAHPAILAALAAANEGKSGGYGEDRWTLEARELCQDLFETELDMMLVASGTAANALALSVLCPTIGAVLCHDMAHIQHDERGAVEFFTGGGRLRTLEGPSGKIDPAALEGALAHARREFVHETPPEALSLTNLTECGAAYTPEETAGLCAMAKAEGMGVHLDGARLANALAHLGCAPADLTWRAGVDIASFGASKNGAMACEAILVFGKARERLAELRARAKRAGHLPAKTRYLGAQMAAYLRGGLWLELAQRANEAARALARRLETQEGLALAHPLEGNEVFVRMDATRAETMRAEGWVFYPWPDGSHRFVASWCDAEPR